MREDEEEAKVGGKGRREGGRGQKRKKVCKLSSFICSSGCETEEREIWGGRNDERGALRRRRRRREIGPEKG